MLYLEGGPDSDEGGPLRLAVGVDALVPCERILLTPQELEHLLGPGPCELLDLAMPDLQGAVAVRLESHQQ